MSRSAQRTTNLDKPPNRLSKGRTVSWTDRSSVQSRSPSQSPAPARHTTLHDFHISTDPDPDNPATPSKTRQTSTILAQVQSLLQQCYRRFRAATPLQRALLILVLVLNTTVLAVFLRYSSLLFDKMTLVAESWKAQRFGWLILWSLTFLTAFPPLFGYATCLTLTGFIYGFPYGWPIVATATVAGSSCSFLLCRTPLADRIRARFRKCCSCVRRRGVDASGSDPQLSQTDTRFQALGAVLRQDGIKLLIMIRLCPLPYSLSNAAIAAFPTVRFAQFVSASAAATPKLLIAVFVGSRLAIVSRSGDGMDGTTVFINWAGILLGSALGAGTGWWIYRRTMARAAQFSQETGILDGDEEIDNADTNPDDEFHDDGESSLDRIERGEFRDRSPPLPAVKPVRMQAPDRGREEKRLRDSSVVRENGKGGLLRHDSDEEDEDDDDDVHDVFSYGDGYADKHVGR